MPTTRCLLMDAMLMDSRFNRADVRATFEQDLRILDAG